MRCSGVLFDVLKVSAWFFLWSLNQSCRGSGASFSCPDTHSVHDGRHFWGFGSLSMIWWGFWISPSGLGCWTAARKSTKPRAARKSWVGKPRCADGTNPYKSYKSDLDLGCDRSFVAMQRLLLWGIMSSNTSLAFFPCLKGRSSALAALK